MRTLRDRAHRERLLAFMAERDLFLDMHVQHGLLGAVAIHAGYDYSSSRTNSEGSTSRALAILRMVEGYAVPVLSIRERVSFDTPALSPSSRKLKTRFLRRVLRLRTFTSTWTVYIICITFANNKYIFWLYIRYVYTKYIQIWYNEVSIEKWSRGCVHTPGPGPQRKEATVDEEILAQPAQHSPTNQEHEDSEERNCFYCLEEWAFFGSLGHDGEEVIESIRCRRCKGANRKTC
jgi:hypothetical protein